MAKTTVAVNSRTNETISEDSITAMATRLGTSRTNLNDVTAGREGRVGVKDRNGEHWIVAAA